MSPDASTKLYYGFGGLIVGAALVATIGFSPLLGWKSRPDYTRMMESTVVTTRAEICAAQFQSAPNYQESLKELRALSYSDKPKFIAKGGWNKLPGDQKNNDAVTQACIDRLEAQK